MDGLHDLLNFSPCPSPAPLTSFGEARETTSPNTPRKRKPSALPSPRPGHVRVAEASETACTAIIRLLPVIHPVFLFRFILSNVGFVSWKPRYCTLSVHLVGYLPVKLVSGPSTAIRIFSTVKQRLTCPKSISLRYHTRADPTPSKRDEQPWLPLAMMLDVTFRNSG